MKNSNSVILNDYEVNGYQDSDFYIVVYHRDENRLEELLYNTTRCGFGEDIRKNYLPLCEAKESDLEAAKQLLENHAKRKSEAKHLYNFENGIAKAGDLVEVCKGRKYAKGLQFVVKQEKEVSDRFGRFVADYLIGEGGEYINADNVKIIKQGPCKYLPADFGILTRR